MALFGCLKGENISEPHIHISRFSMGWRGRRGDEFFIHGCWVKADRVDPDWITLDLHFARQDLTAMLTVYCHYVVVKKINNFDIFSINITCVYIIFYDIIDNI